MRYKAFLPVSGHMKMASSRLVSLTHPALSCVPTDSSILYYTKLKQLWVYRYNMILTNQSARCTSLSHLQLQTPSFYPYSVYSLILYQRILIILSKLLSFSTTIVNVAKVKKICMRVNLKTQDSLVSLSSGISES